MPLELAHGLEYNQKILVDKVCDIYKEFDEIAFGSLNWLIQNASVYGN